MAETDIHNWPLPDGVDRPVVHLDLKALADAMDGQVPYPCTSTTRPPNIPGLFIFESDTKRTRQGDGTKWNMVMQPWTAYTPRLDGTWNLGSTGNSKGSYMLSGNWCNAAGTITWGGTGVGQPQTFPYVAIALPFQMLGLEGGGGQHYFGNLSHMWDGFGGGIKAGFMIGGAGTDGFQVFSHPTGAQGMGPISDYGFKAGTIISWQFSAYVNVPE
jgi:hypothetical protein